MNPNKKNTGDVNDEVEELLRAAQDATLLKLNLNSHTVHASPSDLNPDLEQRFRDLKTGSKPKAKPESITRKTPLESVNEKKEVEEDDLLARFEALKASLPKPSSQIGSSSFLGIGESDDGCLDEDDEVEKVISWAMDAARLDPSRDSDDEDTRVDDDDHDDDETSDEEDVENSQRKPKGHHK